DGALKISAVGRRIAGPAVSGLDIQPPRHALGGAPAGRRNSGTEGVLGREPAVVISAALTPRPIAWPRRAASHRGPVRGSLRARVTSIHVEADMRLAGGRRPQRPLVLSADTRVGA